MNKSILITGCSSGIGYDAALTLRDRGWQVFATVRNQADQTRLTQLGLTTLILDYEKPDTISAALAQVLAATGGTLDALFNNGAYAIPGAVEDLPRDALRANFEANVFGYHDLTRQVIPIMRAQGHGRILNCSSILGFIPARWRGSYVATKYALEGLTDVLRLEMRGTGIDIVLIDPGPITSDIRRNSIPHFERWIDWKSSPRAKEYERSLVKRLYADRGPDIFELPASAVTKKLIHALESRKPKARYFVTTPTYLMGIAKRILPTSALDWLTAKS